MPAVFKRPAAMEPPIGRGALGHLISALVHLHGLGLIHADLKPDNILVFEGGGTVVLKLADVGLAVEVQPSVRAYTCTSSSFLDF